MLSFSGTSGCGVDVNKPFIWFLISFVHSPLSFCSSAACLPIENLRYYFAVNRFLCGKHILYVIFIAFEQKEVIIPSLVQCALESPDRKFIGYSCVWTEIGFAFPGTWVV